jgi:hypothetical protein
MNTVLAIHQSLASIRSLEGWGGETIALSDWVDGSLRWLAGIYDLRESPSGIWEPIA